MAAGQRRHLVGLTLAEKRDAWDEWGELADSLRACAEELRIPPARVPRERLIAFGHPDPSRTWHYVKQLGPWGEVRARALGSLEGIPDVPDGHRLRGVSTLVGTDGKARLRWIKTQREEESRAEVLARLLAEIPPTIQRREGTVPPPDATDGDLLAVYPWGDPHLGMLAWAPETGESWDLSRGVRIHEEAISALVEQGPRAHRALLVPLGDTFHADDSSNRTARGGHALDVDGRFPKIVSAGLRLLVYAADRLLEHHGEVTIDPICGNHDDHTSLMLAIALDAYYHEEPRVSVSLSPAVHRYHRFGRCLLGLTHGHTGKLAALAGVMACDQPEAWGQTDHRLWLTGHRHKTERVEFAGCVVETFRTLAPADAWTRGKGYRSGRDMCRIVLHRDHGEMGRTIVSASYLAARMAGAA